MAEVMVSVSGRPYRLACADGEEERLAELGRSLDARVAKLRSELGELGDMRLVVMVGIALIDEMQDVARDMDRLRGEVAGLTVADRQAAEEIQRGRDGAAVMIGEIAERLERLAQEIADELRRG
jgi:cell division protein ZapA